MKIAVATEFNNSYKEISKVTIPIYEEYCKRHGYVFAPLYLVDDNWAFKKHEWFKELFELGYSAVLYLDIDAIFTNLFLSVENFIDSEHNYYLTRDFNELNNGVCIIKNTKGGRWVNDMILEGKRNYENEQNCINAYMKVPNFNQHIKVLPHPSINSYRYDLYPECKDFVGREDCGDWKEGHFILHTPGLALDKRLEVLSQAKITR